MKKVTVFLLSSDRPRLIVEMIESIFAQSYKEFEFVVSDNSEHDEVEQLLRSRYPSVRFIRRKPRLPALVHFETILNEIETEFFVLLHDDDIVLPDYLEKMINVMRQNETLAASCCNAWIMKDTRVTNKKFSKQMEASCLIRSPDALAKQYLAISDGNVPFPAYIYRSEKVKGLSLKYNEGGKYADVSFLMKVASRGPICWINEPLMMYRLHSSNDSKAESIGQKLKLLRFIYQNTNLNRHSDIVSQYRFRYWTKWLLKTQKGKINRHSVPKLKAIVSFVIGYGIRTLLTHPILFTRLVYKNIS